MKSLEQNLSEIHQKADRLIEKKERKLKALKTACLISAVSVCFALLTLAGFAAAAKLRRQHEKTPDDITDDSNIPEGISIEQMILPANEEDVAASGRKYVCWNELEVTEELENALRSNLSVDGNGARYLALNAFRRDGRLLSAEDGGFLSDYQYEGKTYAEFEAELLGLSEKKERLLRLQKEGEILKYGKDVLVSTGVPRDDIKIDAADRGLVWAGEFYDNAVSYYNSFNPGFLSEYIVDGVFLSGKARDDLEFIANELFNTENKRKKYFDAYYSQHDPKDAAFFGNAGLISGEIDGRLYILVTLDDFSRLAETCDCSGLTFSFLPREYYPDVLTYSYLPDGFSLDKSVTGYDLSKISFEIYDPKTGEQQPDRAFSEEDFYRLFAELIDINKKLHGSVQFGIFSLDENGKQLKTDPEILSTMNYTGSYSALSGEIYIAVQYEDLDLHALRDLSLRTDISQILISAPYAVPDNVNPLADPTPDGE